jgi:hypothetical protein
MDKKIRKEIEDYVKERRKLEKEKSLKFFTKLSDILFPIAIGLIRVLFWVFGLFGFFAGLLYLVESGKVELALGFINIIEIILILLFIVTVIFIASSFTVLIFRIKSKRRKNGKRSEKR